MKFNQLKMVNKKIVITVILSLFVLILVGCSNKEVTMPIDAVDETIDTDTTPETGTASDTQDNKDTSEDEIIQGIEDAEDLEEELDMDDLESFDSDLEDFQI
jgi:uncharacterized lipoprotein NlpE involved in copper resistance